MSRTRRPSVSIYDYPEHLNPFNDDNPNLPPVMLRDGKASKEHKNKFWTFGRSRKSRSNSFSIKSTWSGLFGKRKEPTDMREKRSTITTVSTTYKREPFDRPVVAPRHSRDQQEFDEALGTLARRRKYTLDNTSTCSSSLTVNGDPARIYDGSPQETTASIMGDLTPKPPARRFGQVSPRPTDKIPPLNYEDKESKENGTAAVGNAEGTPVPPMRRFGNRSSQRFNAGTLESEDEASRSADVTLRDENENVPEDYVFKRCSQDVVRQSNLSINSCVSVTSTASTYGRKKRRAPQPPCRKEQLETPVENESTAPSASKIELQIVEPLDIARVAENIDEMTKRSHELDENISSQKSKTKTNDVVPQNDSDAQISTSNVEKKDSQKPNVEDEKSKSTEQSDPVQVDSEHLKESESSSIEVEDSKETTSEDQSEKYEKIEVELRKTSQENLEFIKDVEQVNTAAELEEVCLRRKSSSSNISRSDSFSVKEEIEKIEKQIKALETKGARDSSDASNVEDPLANTRSSILANRRHFFQDMVDSEKNTKNGVKIEFKELPREQKDIRVVRLTDPPVPVEAPTEPVKIIELHISEPIKQKPEIVDDVNPIPKPRRHNSLNTNGSQPAPASREEKRVLNMSDKRGQSV